MMHHLARTCPFFVVLLLLAGTAFAQDVPEDEEGAQLPPRGSNRALSFTFDQLSLGSLNGGIGGKYWIGAFSALRLSLDFGVESTENVSEPARDDGRSAVEAGASILVELHRQERGRVSPYLGSGFGIRAGAFSQTTDFAPGSTIRRRRLKGSSTDFDVNVVFGIEYRLARRVSLSGEHEIAARIRLEKSDLKQTPSDPALPSVTTEEDLRSFLFDLGSSRLILSVYF